jgi:hypothetical protein
MKKALQLIGFIAVAAAAVIAFSPEAQARVTGFLYGKGLFIETIRGTTVASINTAGALTVTGITNSGALSATAITGATSVTSPLIVGTGAIRLHSRTAAQINALTSVAIGDAYYCSNCAAVTMCVSTGTVVNSFVKVSDKTAVCG